MSINISHQLSPSSSLVCSHHRPVPHSSPRWRPPPPPRTPRWGRGGGNEGMRGWRDKEKIRRERKREWVRRWRGEKWVGKDEERRRRCGGGEIRRGCELIKKDGWWGKKEGREKNERRDTIRRKKKRGTVKRAVKMRSIKEMWVCSGGERSKTVCLSTPLPLPCEPHLTHWSPLRSPGAWRGGRTHTPLGPMGRRKRKERGKITNWVGVNKWMNE